MTRITAETVVFIGPPMLLVYARAVSVCPIVQGAGAICNQTASTNHHPYVRYLAVYTSFKLFISITIINNNNNNNNNHHHHHLTKLTTGSLLLLQACARRRSKAPHVTSAVKDVVAEIQLSTDEGDTSFDTFITHNTQRISDIVNEYQQRHE